MQTGDQFKIVINDIAFGGDGVGRAPDGRAVFVPFTAPQEEVEIEVTEVQRNFARGEVRQMSAGADCRAEPQCPYFGRCGGCQYQHLDATAEAQIKHHQLTELLARIGHLEALPEVVKIAEPQEVYGYRNKLSLSPILARQGEGSLVQDYGFHERDGHTLFAVDQCPIADAALNELLPTAKHSADAQRNATRRKPGRLVLRKPARGDAAAFVGGVSRPRQGLQEELLGKPVDVPALSFFQVNPSVADRVVETVARFYADSPTPFVIDAYAGVGTFSLALGIGPEQTLLVERDRQAIGAARHNHSIWGLGGRDYLVASAEDVMQEALSKVGTACRETTVILDPPRSGCAKGVLNAIRTQPVRRIVYVSCDASTLARDLQRLGQDGCYRISYIGWADMFPQTAHFESVVVLESAAEA